MISLVCVAILVLTGGARQLHLYVLSRLAIPALEARSRLLKVRVKLLLALLVCSTSADRGRLLWVVMMMVDRRDGRALVTDQSLACVEEGAMVLDDAALFDKAATLRVVLLNQSVLLHIICSKSRTTVQRIDHVQVSINGRL